MVDRANLDVLRKEIEACGAPDRYIDEQEEKHLYERGEGLQLKRETVQALINQMCRDFGWTLEHDIIADVMDVLHEATMDDGVIDQMEFEHCINYAVSMNMPRRRAMEIGIGFIEDKGFKTKRGLLGKDWYTPLRNQYIR